MNDPTPLSSEERVSALAEHITRHIFDIGVEGGERPKRIEYKIGDWRTKEYGVGGLCEDAMRKYVAEAIRNFEVHRA